MNESKPVRPRIPMVAAAIAIALCFFFAYWPTLVELQDRWEHEPDYSHGYLVPFLAIGFLWLRRDTFPGVSERLGWLGLGLIGASILMRVGGAMLFLNPVDGWSIVLWVAGAVWFLFGARTAWWAMPSTLYLLFMVPLPYRMESWLSVPLQGAATKASTWTLQLLGVPALAEGNVIQIGENQLFVEEACSGLRIFVGILALAFAYLIVVRRSWWERLLLLVSVLPIALIANSVRIVTTAILYQVTTSEVARHFSHDWAGYFMIPFAAVLFALVLWYIGALLRKVEQVDVRTAVRQSGA